MTATPSSPSTHRAAAASLRPARTPPTNFHRIIAPTTATTVTRATITPTLTPRRPDATARWLPVHSPPSQSPPCWRLDGVDGVAVRDGPELRGRLIIGVVVVRVIVLGILGREFRRIVVVGGIGVLAAVSVDELVVVTGVLDVVRFVVVGVFESR